jgi:hypothetical protein
MAKATTTSSRGPGPTFAGKGKDFQTALDVAARRALRRGVPAGAILDVVRVQVRLENPHVGEYFVDIG